MDFSTMMLWILAVTLAGAIGIIVYLALRAQKLRLRFQERARIEIRHQEFLPPVPSEIALRSARERRGMIESTLAEFGVTLTLEYGGEGRLAALPFALRETPPESSRPGRRELEEVAAAAQMSWLSWQMHSEELLLAERVVDTVLGVHEEMGGRQLDAHFARVHVPLIRLTGPDPALVRKGLFPWKVIIETDNPAAYVGQLRRHSQWLAIGIDFAPARRVSRLGLCQRGIGIPGIAGGILRTQQGTYAMTCNHVLSSSCASVRYWANPARDELEPDAALIERENPCFRTIGADRNVRPADPAIIRDCVIEKTRVEKRGTGARANLGVIRSSHVVGIDLDGDYCRFPHIEVVPADNRPMWLSPLATSFSRRGESGSWVIETARGSWLGMVIGEDERHTATFVATAGPLLDFFERRMANGHPPRAEACALSF